MKPGLLVILGIALFVNMHSAAALSTPSITFIPDQISVDSSFLMVVQHTESVPIRVSWWADYGQGILRYGSLPKEGGRWVCYFSNSDAAATCGPSPFTEPGNNIYTLYIESTDSNGITATTNRNMNIGNVVLVPDVVYNNGSIYMTVGGSSLTSASVVQYKVYNADTLSLVAGKSGSMAYDPTIFKHKANTNLGPGIYYVAFTATAGGNFGGGVVPITIQETVQPPDGGEGGNQTPASYPLAMLDEINRTVLQSEGRDYEYNSARVKNTGSKTLGNLTTAVPFELRDYLTVSLANVSLSGSGITNVRVKVSNIGKGIGINSIVDVYSGAEKAGEIPIRIFISTQSNGSVVSCAGQPDRTLCLGGICCSNVCQEYGECCSDIDCGAGNVCSDNRCVDSSSNQCPQGSTCNPGTGAGNCPQGTEYVRQNCIIGDGFDGVCCKPVIVNECEGKTDGTACTGGLCVFGNCRRGAECVSDAQCTGNEVCSNNQCVEEGTVRDGCSSGATCMDGTDCPDGYEYEGVCDYTQNTLGVCCRASTGGSGGLDPLMIGAVGGVVVVVLAVLLVLRRRRGKRGAFKEEFEEGNIEEEFPEEGGSEEEER